MYHGAMEADLPKHGWACGLIHDEMAIQSELVIKIVDGIPRLIGWVESAGEKGEHLRV